MRFQNKHPDKESKSPRDIIDKLRHVRDGRHRGLEGSLELSAEERTSIPSSASMMTGSDPPSPTDVTYLAALTVRILATDYTDSSLTTSVRIYVRKLSRIPDNYY